MVKNVDVLSTMLCCVGPQTPKHDYLMHLGKVHFLRNWGILALQNEQLPSHLRTANPIIRLSDRKDGFFHDHIDLSQVGQEGLLGQLCILVQRKKKLDGAPSESLPPSVPRTPTHPQSRRGCWGRNPGTGPPDRTHLRR